MWTRRVCVWAERSPSNKHFVHLNLDGVRRYSKKKKCKQQLCSRVLNWKLLFCRMMFKVLRVSLAVTTGFGCFSCKVLHSDVTYWKNWVQHHLTTDGGLIADVAGAVSQIRSTHTHRVLIKKIIQDLTGVDWADLYLIYLSFPSLTVLLLHCV